MFGIKFVDLGHSYLMLTATGNSFKVERTGGYGLQGPVGLALARRQLRSAVEYFNESAWAWGCGRQDHYGDHIHALREQVADLGGSHALQWEAI